MDPSPTLHLSQRPPLPSRPAPLRIVNPSPTLHFPLSLLAWRQALCDNGVSATFGGSWRLTRKTEKLSQGLVQLAFYSTVG